MSELGRYTITGHGERAYRLVEDAAGAWMQSAEVLAALAQWEARWAALEKFVSAAEDYTGQKFQSADFRDARHGAWYRGKECACGEVLAEMQRLKDGPVESEFDCGWNAAVASIENGKDTPYRGAARKA